MNRRLPICTLLLAGPAILSYCAPALSHRLVYDRAAILHGEIWRLFTGNWVHFSTAHLVYDLLALIIVGSILEIGGRRFVPMCVMAALAIGTALLVLAPQIQFYGGLSGIATAATVLLALHGLKEQGIWPRICLFGLIAILAKVLFETLTGDFLFVRPASTAFTAVPLSHAIGALTALFVYCTARIDNPSKNFTCAASRTGVGKAYGKIYFIPQRPNDPAAFHLHFRARDRRYHRHRPGSRRFTTQALRQ